ncbi:MAG: Holliday junction resolvase RuvX [Pseudomonadota bacterium]
MPEIKTLLGFDFGERRIGVATGQRITGTASALATLTSRDGRPDWEGITKLIEEWRPDAFVVGMPRNMDGSQHELAKRVTRFGNQLHGRYGKPVFFVDERLSSREAERQLAPGAARRDKGLIDRMAAQVILQDWLDQQRTNHEQTL